MAHPGHIVLASGSPYRARMLTEAGYQLVIDPPDIDERCADHLLDEVGPGALAVELARRKAHEVAPRHPASVILAGDQVGVVGASEGMRMLSKQTGLEAAVDQLMAISGTVHHLYNGMYALEVDTGESVCDVDVQEVTMRHFDAQEARRYVERFEPFDTAGSYRMEDGDAMGEVAPFVTSVVGEDPTGVLGVPIPMVERLLVALRTRVGGLGH